MLEKYEWISNERQFFGQPNTAYDFAANDMKEVSRRLSKLQETKEKLGKNVNMRAMNMLGKAEEKVRQSKNSIFLEFSSALNVVTWKVFLFYAFWLSKTEFKSAQRA